MISKIEELRNKCQKLQEELNEEVKKEFSNCIKELFENHPDLRSISWTQYTPYFNDGDVCTFRSCHSYPNINEEEDDYDGDGVAHCSKETEKAVYEFLKVFHDDDMEHMFGDHAKVVVTKDSVEVEEYSHD